MPSFIKQESLKDIEEIENNNKLKEELQEKLNKIREESKKLDLEYLLRQKQIATYLEYKKTFFGKVKYYIKRKEFLKKDIIKKENKEKEENKKDINDSVDNKYITQKKDIYNLEELVLISKQKQEKLEVVKNLKLDIDAGEIKNKNIQSKIKNAKLYIEEIDKHTKSIFEFWKFANKDKIDELPEPEQQDIRKIKKVFDIEQDLEELEKQLDTKQRNILLKEETDSIFLTTTNILSDINSILNKEEIDIKNKIKELFEEAAISKKMVRKRKV